MLPPSTENSSIHSAIKSAVLNNVPPIRRLFEDREALRAELRSLREELAQSHGRTAKSALAHLHLKGCGIEIGAFDQPLPVAPGVKVQYFDRYSTAELKAFYPDSNPVAVDLVGDGETLAELADGSQDFIIASHFFEHCQNPIGTLKNLLRVVKVGGFLFLVIPDKRFTFDAVREITPFAHIRNDYLLGPEVSQRAHCEEWARVIDKIADPAAREVKVKHLLDTNWPIHYHVWTAADVLEMFIETQKLPGLNYSLEAFHGDGLFEVTALLRRTI